MYFLNREMNFVKHCMHSKTCNVALKDIFSFLKNSAQETYNSKVSCAVIYSVNFPPFFFSKE